MRKLSAFACMAILAVALMLTVLLTGCSQKEQVPADNGPAAPANPSNKQATPGAGGGAAADMTPIPAPSGVKVGLEGGRKGP